ncbi:MAG: ABC transporter substrate-binding protein [Phycisphaerales bacterium]|nr:MAG: ABC transporter substrate-binding protein [Phycisphaerales bacterium]
MMALSLSVLPLYPTFGEDEVPTSLLRRAAPTVGLVLAERSGPQRIITIAPNSAEIICALGACKRIVGVSKFCTYPAELQRRPRVGGLFDPDIERMVALRPDLVVLRGRSDAVENLCRRLKTPIYMDQTDTLPGIETCIIELGEKLSLQPRAQELLKQFRIRLAAIRDRVADRPRPRVLLTISRQPDKMADILTTGKGTFLDQMLDVAGGVNVFGHLDMTYPQVSAESIIAQRPEVIIELMPEVDLTEALRRQILAQWSKLGSVLAVARKRIHFVADENCLIPSMRYVEIIEKVSKLLHPEEEIAP